MVGTKNKITEKDIVMLEMALNLKALSDFENNFINNLKLRFNEYGFEMVITKNQKKILDQLNTRYKKAYNF